VGQLEEARKRLGSIGASPRHDLLRIPPNAATRASDRNQEALEAGDPDAVARLCAPTMVYDDRRHAIRLTGDRDTFIATSRHIPSSGLRLSRTLLATAGDRLALYHLRWTGMANGGAFEGENLSLTEVDAEGRILAIISFDLDDRRAASAEMRARFSQSDASRWMPARVFELACAAHDHDLGRLRAVVPDSFIFHDHRRAGPGRIEGAAAYIAWLAALFELSPDATIEVLYTIGADSHAYLAVAHTFGTRVQGGPFESVFLQLVSFPDGQPVGAELFELEDIDVARERFEALRRRSP